MLQSLLSTSLDSGTTKFLRKLPRWLLEKEQLEAVEWVIDYEERYGQCPTPVRFSKTPYRAWYSKVFVSADPLSDVYDSAVDELKASKTRSLLNEMSDLLDEGTPIGSQMINDLMMAAYLGTASQTASIKEIDRAPIYDSNKKLYTLGLYTIDGFVGGMLDGECLFLAGRPGVGKTTILCHIAIHLASAGHKVLFNSKEMPNDAIIGKLDSTLAGFNSSDIRLGKVDQATVASIPTSVHQLLGDIVLPRIPCITPRDLFAAAEQCGADVVIADGMYLMHSDSVRPTNSRAWESVAAVTSDLKEMALAHQKFLIGSTQLKRQGDDQELTLESIAYSDTVGQDGDVVLLLTRDNKDSVSILIGKNRNGAEHIGQVVTFDHQTGQLIQGGP